MLSSELCEDLFEKWIRIYNQSGRDLNRIIIMPSLKTVRGWEKDFEVKLDYDVIQGKVDCLQ